MQTSEAANRGLAASSLQLGKQMGTLGGGHQHCGAGSRSCRVRALVIHSDHDTGSLALICLVPAPVLKVLPPIRRQVAYGEIYMPLISMVLCYFHF